MVVLGRVGGTISNWLVSGNPHDSRFVKRIRLSLVQVLSVLILDLWWHVRTDKTSPNCHGTWVLTTEVTTRAVAPPHVYTCVRIVSSEHQHPARDCAAPSMAWWTQVHKRTLTDTEEEEDVWFCYFFVFVEMLWKQAPATGHGHVCHFWVCIQVDFKSILVTRKLTNSIVTFSTKHQSLGSKFPWLDVRTAGGSYSQGGKTEPQDELLTCISSTLAWSFRLSGIIPVCNEARTVLPPLGNPPRSACKQFSFLSVCSGSWLCGKFEVQTKRHVCRLMTHLWDFLRCLPHDCSLEPVSPETQATNGHFGNYQKWSRFKVNYQNRRTSMFWFMLLSTKIDATCFQMFRANSGTNADGCRWHDGVADVSNTE